MAIAGMSIRLYFDHNGNPRLAEYIRKAGNDAIAAREVGNGRCIFTHDLDDFPVLAVAWARDQQNHAGIIVSQQPPRLPYGELLRRLLRLLDTLTAEEMVNRLEWLDNRWSDRPGST